MTARIYDATALGSLSRCEREFWLRHCRDLTGTRDEDAPHFGQVLHVGRDVFFRTESVALALRAMYDAWGEYESEQDEKRTLKLALDMMAKYAETVGPPSKRGFTVLHGEQPIVNASEQHGGIVDAIEDVGGELAVDDLKTSAMAVSASAMSAYDHNEQLAGYLDRAEEFVGRPVAHAWVEFWFVSFRKEGPKAEDFKRYGPIYYSESLKAELRALRHRRIELAERLRTGRQAPEANPFACVRYNRLCTFFSACKADLDVREAVIASRLAAGEWVEKAWDFQHRGSG
jgi:hypothetical protein